MKRAKSRLAHNKGCRRAKVLGGGYIYVKGSRMAGVQALLVTIIMGACINLVASPAPELLSPLGTSEAVAKTVEPTPEPTAIPTATPTPEPQIARLTAYSCGGLETEAEIAMNCPSLKYAPNGRTANGTEPIPNITAACDKANMGRRFHIDGIGIVICTDTGGAIKGPGRFDLYVENVQKAREFGVQYRNYHLEEE